MYAQEEEEEEEEMIPGVFEESVCPRGYWHIGTPTPSPHHHHHISYELPLCPSTIVAANVSGYRSSALVAHPQKNVSHGPIATYV